MTFTIRPEKPETLEGLPYFHHEHPEGLRHARSDPSKRLQGGDAEPAGDLPEGGAREEVQGERCQVGGLEVDKPRLR
uniref:Uncharacterized protein n=1 Tax=Steinernema glaseri TaxID=37863 RepID=A0A1I8A1I2_9BILA